MINKYQPFVQWLPLCVGKDKMTDTGRKQPFRNISFYRAVFEIQYCGITDYPSRFSDQEKAFAVLGQIICCRYVYLKGVRIEWISHIQNNPGVFYFGQGI